MPAIPGGLPVGGRVSGASIRPRIYQLFLRQFGNTHDAPVPNGTLARNGVGRFRDLDTRALRGLRAMGVTHLWLMGILRQATATGYPELGLPADDPDLLKGLAGSPFAIRDCFDVCPDYATDPSRRREEFGDLVRRCHRHGLRVLIDFVPNHVARSHRTVVRPDLEFGTADDRSVFYAPDNHFFYLRGEPPLRLPTVVDGRAVSPTCRVTGGCDGLFEGERDHGKVTGNNVVSWTPGVGDWYETVKLNYGFDFTQGRRAVRDHPTATRPDVPVPATWHRMDAILAHWQGMGVDGFRCDMAHWIPLEFWEWAIGRARARRPGALFVAEAYDDDPNKLTDGNVLAALVEAGFDAVYDDLSYDVLKGVFDGPKWANDLDAAAGAVAPLHASLRYAENHDEVRLANPSQWAGIGAAVGRPVTALLFALGRGPVLLYNGQEVGEPAVGAEGFGGDDARTSIFDYGSMPALVRWVNGHRYDGGRLSAEERALRGWYARLLRLMAHPALAHGEFLPLNGANVDNPRFGRLEGETASGHWLYACVRHDPGSGRRILVVVNLHPTATLANVTIRLTAEARAALGLAGGGGTAAFHDRLGGAGAVRFRVHTGPGTPGELALPAIPPLTPWYLEVR